MAEREQLERSLMVRMAKPGIPIEKPQRREVPDAPNPIPERRPAPTPEPVNPAKTPSSPVPVGKIT